MKMQEQFNVFESDWIMELCNHLQGFFKKNNAVKVSSFQTINNEANFSSNLSVTLIKFKGIILHNE